MVRTCVLLLAGLLGGCAIPNTIEALDDRSPPPEFGRPTWVRVSAGVGAWIGGIVGGVASVALLPITWPLSVLAGDGLGEAASSELVLLPAMGGAAIGHCLLGTPPDVVDYVFRRAWTGTPDPVVAYDFVPMPGAGLPQPVAPEPAPTVVPAGAPPPR